MGISNVDDNVIHYRNILDDIQYQLTVDSNNSSLHYRDNDSLINLKKRLHVQESGLQQKSRNG